MTCAKPDTVVKSMRNELLTKCLPSFSEERDAPSCGVVLEGGDVQSDQLRNALTEAKEGHQQTQALLTAVCLLSKLASLDSSLYSSTLSGGCGESNGSLPQIDPDQDASSLQNRIDDIQKQWKLEETEIPMLLHSIHRLQSAISQLVKEADEQSLYLQSMEVYCTKQEKREKKLVQAIQKLTEKNRKLEEKLRTTKKERKSIIRSVKNYVRKRQEMSLEEQRVATQLNAHERLLRLERLDRAALDDGVPSVGESRSRLSTFESVSERSRTTTSDSLDSDAVLDEGVSIFSNISSVSSASSLVTDEGIATIRYKQPSLSTVRRKQPPKGPEDDAWLNMRAAFGCAKPLEASQPTTQTLTFPAGSKVGLQFHKVPWEQKALDVTETLTLNKGLLTEAFLDNNESLKKQAEDKGTKPDRSRRLDFSSVLRRSSRDEEGLRKADKGDEVRSVFRLGSDDSVPPKRETSGYCAFLVCGLVGFDCQQNVKPDIGSRLVAVNNHSLETEEWTFAQIREATESSSGAVDGIPATYTLTFRNDKLNKKQQSMLKKAVKTTAERISPEYTKDSAPQSSTSAEDASDTETDCSSRNDGKRGLKVEDDGGSANNADVTQSLEENYSSEACNVECKDRQIGEKANTGDEKRSKGDKDVSLEDQNLSKGTPETFRKSMMHMGTKFKALF